MKPSGWKGRKGDRYWTKDSAFGRRYRCQSCDHETRGFYFGSDEARMHRTDCAVRVVIAAKEVRP